MGAWEEYKCCQQKYRVAYIQCTNATPTPTMEGRALRQSTTLMSKPTWITTMLRIYQSPRSLCQRLGPSLHPRCFPRHHLWFTQGVTLPHRITHLRQWLVQGYRMPWVTIYLILNMVMMI